MQLGLTIVFSMVASLISAITLVPLFFKLYKPTQKKELRLNVFLNKIKEKYDHVERKLLHKKKTCLLTAVLLLVASFWILSMTNIVSMPTMDEGMISVTATFRPGTRVEVVNEQIVQIEDLVAADENVESYTLTASAGSATISATLKDDRKMTTQEVVDQWVQDTKNVSDMQLDITMSSSMSMGSSTTGSGATLTVGSVNLEDVKDASEMIQDAAWNIPVY